VLRLEFGTQKSWVLDVATSEKKTGFLLIAVFSKPFNPNNDGSPEAILGGYLLFIRVNGSFAFVPLKQNSLNEGEFIGTPLPMMS
jgi:hypothetical protein